MSGLGRGLFVYWKLPRADVAAASAAVHAFQTEWHRRGVQAGLHERADDAGATATLMETYSAPNGLEAEVEAEIIAASARALAAWAAGPRHVEVFVRRVPVSTPAASPDAASPPR